MKFLVTVTMMSLLSLASYAEQDPIPRKIKNLPELCQLETDYSHRLFESHAFDVTQMPGLSKDLLYMVNVHLKQNGYNETGKSLTHKQIKEIFSDEGIAEYDDLNVILLKHRGSGKQYVYVQSYPGDNEYGVYFDAKTQEVIATNGDGSIDLITNHGDISCYRLIE